MPLLSWGAKSKFLAALGMALFLSHPDRRVASRTSVRARGAETSASRRVDPISDNIPYDGHFTFTRVKYTVGNGGYYYRGLPSWAHGYDHAERNLLKITDAVTNMHPHLEGSNIIALDDPKLFRYPIAYMTEGGYWVLTDREIIALRKYLTRGGFLILDDTRNAFSPGNMGWPNIEANFKPFQHIGILSLEFHVDKLSRPLL